MHFAVTEEAGKGRRVVLPKLDLQPALRLLITLVCEAPHSTEHVLRYVEDDEFWHDRLSLSGTRCESDVTSDKRPGAGEGSGPSLQMRVPQGPRMDHIRPDCRVTGTSTPPAAAARRTASSNSVSAAPT